MELRPGALVAGRYRVDRKIGSGGMGEVWAGEHVAIGLRVALKTLLPAAALDRQVVARFRREAQLLGRLRSDRVARVVDFVEDPSFGLVLVMDLIEGEPLGSVLQTRRVGVEEAIDLGVDIVTALADLHHVAVVHRDLKPDNIILEPLRGGRRRAVIVDLGVSRLLASSHGESHSEEVTSITHADMAVGTLTYMAPEQILSSSTVTGAADVYAVGAILYRAVSGEQVFGDRDDVIAARDKLSGEAPPLSLARVDRVARGFAAVVARALQRVPEQRFRSAEEMQQELVALQDLARAMSFDLDAATEEAPPSLLTLAETSGAPTEPMSQPPAMSLARDAPPISSAVPVVYDDSLFEEATRLSPASLRLLAAAGGGASRSAAQAVSGATSSFPATHPAGPPPPIPSAPSTPPVKVVPTPRPAPPTPKPPPRRPFDRTLESPGGPVSLPEAPAVSSLPTGSGRPTVVSPISPPVACADPATFQAPVARLPAPSLVAAATLQSLPKLDRPASRAVPLRLAVVGLVVTLAAGTGLGLAVQRLLGGPAPREMRAP